jgi:hypothetical protein
MSSLAHRVAESRGRSRVSAAPPKSPRRNSFRASRYHYLARKLLDDGFAPNVETLQQFLAFEALSIEALKRMDTSHCMVCHSDSATPWVIHPFSLGHSDLGAICRARLV